VPSVSNAAAVNGDCADAATVVTASDTAGDDAVGAEVAEVAAVADVADDAAASVAGVVEAVDDADGDELEHAAPARPSTASPPKRKNARRSARSGRGTRIGDLVMVQSNTDRFRITQDLLENQLRISGRPTTKVGPVPSNPLTDRLRTSATRSTSGGNT
jgi:hypothetical protein